MFVNVCVSVYLSVYMCIGTSGCICIQQCVCTYITHMTYHDAFINCFIYFRSLRSSGSDDDLELVKHIKEHYIHRVHQAVQVRVMFLVDTHLYIICFSIDHEN